MSGKPYPEGVVKVAKLLERHEALSAEIEVLRPKVQRFGEARTELSAVDNQLREALQYMDLETQGNSGFGGRMGWFLLAMRRIARGETHE